MEVPPQKAKLQVVVGGILTGLACAATMSENVQAHSCAWKDSYEKSCTFTLS
jgi:hypothetical protein